jgi:hypothetical protein
MNPSVILQLRLKNQQLHASSYKKPEELVRWMGAVQAQDYAGCKWAVGVRTMNATDSSVEQAINKGKIVRTHVLRPTWHLVHPEDIRWMLMLTAPRVHAASAFGYRQMELTDAIFKRAHKVLIKSLQGGKELTRIELAKAMQQAKIATDELRFIHLMVHAELEGIVCNGARRDKQFTYALLDERVPPAKPIKREDALIKLTERYFGSHGPATVQDFNWWSGLSAKDAQQGIQLIQSNLISETIQDKTYWMTHATAAIKKPAPSLFLLPAFDEYTVAYKDRSFAVEETVAKKTGNGIFKPLLVIDGKVKGIWKRNDKKGHERVDLTPFEKLTSSEIKLVNKEVQRYSTFLNS